MIKEIDQKIRNVWRRQNCLILVFFVSLLFLLLIVNISFSQWQKQIVKADILRVNKIEIVNDSKVIATIEGALEHLGKIKRACLVFSIDKAKIIFRGNEIEIRDKMGLPAITIGSGKYGGNIVIFNVSSGTPLPTLVIGTSDDGGVLSIHHKTGRSIIALGTLKDRGEIVVWTIKGQELFRTPAR